VPWVQFERLQTITLQSIRSWSATGVCCVRPSWACLTRHMI
jgi:hypothetical protein